MTEVHHDNRIHASELAHHIGYAEYPHVEMARTAFRVGLEQDGRKHLSDAEAAGLEAGHEYLRSAANDVASYVLVSGLPSDEQGQIAEIMHSRSEKYPGVRITKNDMVVFAEERNYTGVSKKMGSDDRPIRPNANKASQSWIALEDLADDLNWPEVNEQRAQWNKRYKPAIKIELDGIKVDQSLSRKYLSFSMDTLVNLLEEFDRLKEEHPSMSTSTILGKKFGDARIAFIRDFVEHKKAQLDDDDAY